MGRLVIPMRTTAFVVAALETTNRNGGIHPEE